jgi:small-conductance mechanosensitive channel
MGLDVTANQFLELFSSVRQGLVAAFPNILTAALVLVLGWGLAWVLRKAVRRLFRSVRNHLAPGSARSAWTEAVDDQRTGDVAAGGVYWLVMLTALVVAIDALGLPAFNRWIGAFAGYLPKVAIAMAVLLGGVIASRLARNAILKTALRVPPTQARNLARLAQVSVLAAAALIAAEQLGLDVSLLTAVFLIGLAAALGGAALAFGLGARELMADILAMHYVQKSYRVGQIVRIGSDQGRIVRTTRTAVVLENVDGELSIPGRHFADQRSVLLNQEEDLDSRN